MLTEVKCCGIEFFTYIYSGKTRKWICEYAGIDLYPHVQGKDASATIFNRVTALLPTCTGKRLLKKNIPLPEYAFTHMYREKTVEEKHPST